MRKRLIDPVRQDTASRDGDWLDLEALASVEISSEDPAHPIEHALRPGQGEGWRASGPGLQTIRLVFDKPQRITRVGLRFVEDRNERTQEYVLRWSATDATPLQDIVRQQWTFSPHGATTQVENHVVELASVRVLELAITPDIGGKPVHASLQELRVG